MFCPSCRSESRPGFTRCPDCDVELVESLPPEDHEAPHYVEVLETADPALVPFLRPTLESAGIPFLIEGEEGLGLFPIGLGNTRFDSAGLAVRVLVPEERVAEARELLENSVLAQAPGDSDTDDEPGVA
jgi:hypothetical protein